MALLNHPSNFKIFIILIFLNSVILCGSQHFVYTKHWDLYWLGAFFYRELLLVVSYFVVFWLLSCAKCGAKIAYIILAISALCFIIDIFLLYNFDTNLNSYLVIVALETNGSEALGFLQNYLSLRLFIIYAIFGIICAWLWRRIKPISISQIALKRLKLLLILAICTLAMMISTHTKPLNEDWSDMLYNYTKQTYRAIQSTYGFLREYERLNANFDNLSKSLKVKPSAEKIANIVLVIGESTQRSRLSLYGYGLKTTPLLDSLKAKESQNLLIFSDVIAPHAQTHESLSLSLSFANQDNTHGIATFQNAKKSNIKPNVKPWYAYLNLIDAFKLGGYHTIAISNQEPISVFGNAAATILKRANEVHFININDKMSTTRFDESLLDALDSIKTYNEANQHKPTLYTLHLMGNHAKYYSRYPSEFGIFTESDMLCKAHLADSAKVLENMHYDNSVLYGDFILHSIIERFSNSDSIVIFFSDHGEEIYDWRNFIGHADSKISRFMVEVPFIVYVSEGFKQKHKALYNRLKNAQNAPYMNDDLMHTMLDIAHIEVPGFESRRSLLNAKSTKRARIVGNKSSQKHYDKDLKPTKSYIEQGLCEVK